jgi:Resolvase, N terminal domain
MFQMLGVFAEFERVLIRTRVVSGLDRARAQGKQLGRPRTDAEAAIGAALRNGLAFGPSHGNSASVPPRFEGLRLEPRTLECWKLFNNVHTLSWPNGYRDAHRCPVGRWLDTSRGLIAKAAAENAVVLFYSDWTGRDGIRRGCIKHSMVWAWRLSAGYVVAVGGDAQMWIVKCGAVARHPADMSHCPGADLPIKAAPHKRVGSKRIE